MTVSQRAPQSVARLLWTEARPVVQAIVAVRYWVGAVVVLAGAAASARPWSWAPWAGRP